jgi:acetyl esterase
VTHRAASTDGPAPSYLLLVYPVLGLPDSTPSYRSRASAFPIGAADMRWFFRHYLAGARAPEPSPDLVPLHADDLAAMPPTHVVLAGHDPLHDEGAAYAARLRHAGVPVTVTDHPDLCHGFLRFTAVSAAARQARSTLTVTVRRACAASRPEILDPGPIHAYDSAATPAESLRAARGEN